MRGEKRMRPRFCSRTAGSPPHARGKALPCGRRAVPDGITPACAGKRRPEDPPARGHRDHPRMRGEKDKPVYFPFLHKGSPPHARGKVPYHGDEDGIMGITPACAGKRIWRENPVWRIGDHPRMRGEKLDVTCGARSIWGSPPHARGKEGKKTGKADNAGITPACAGKRPLEGESANATEDHPRMRGEKSMPMLLALRQAGSPPHARGKD